MVLVFEFQCGNMYLKNLKPFLVWKSSYRTETHIIKDTISLFLYYVNTDLHDMGQSLFLKITHLIP